MLNISDTKAIQVRAALHPLKTERVDLTITEGLTLDEIFACAQPDPYLRKSAHVFIGDAYIPPENWSRVRPKAGALINIRAYAAPRGGSGGKDVLRSVLLIAVAAAALIYAAPLGTALGLSGAFGAAVGQAVIGIGGMLLVNALIPPRTSPSQQSDSPTKFIEGSRNRADPFGVVPDVFGRVRVSPKLAASWYTEIVGDEQYLRGLFHWGVGPINVPPETLKIGDTLLSEFEDYEIEHRQGYVGDAPVTLYPATVNQENFQITLAEPDGYTIRTSSNDADEIGIDFLFPEGLIRINDDGSRSNRAVAVQLQYSVAGAGVWSNIPTAGGTSTFPASWRNDSGGEFNQITFTQKKTNAVRHGVTFKTPSRGQYDIRVKRFTPDTSDDQIRDTVVWSALRTFTNESPVNSPVPVALTAIRIKATDQLNGVIDELSGVPERICLDYDFDTDTWIERATNNNASLFRYAMQSNSLQRKYTDDQIDLVGLAAWHDFCRVNGFSFNQNRDFRTSLYDTLADIAVAGRASPSNVDGKWSVVVDEPKSPVSHVTPRNSRAFEASKAFLTTPHAVRVQFANEQKDYRTDELRVYLDGYDETNATIFETSEIPGVTDPVALTKHVRFNNAVAVHRPEQFTFVQDMERLVYRRGDRIKLTHDVIMIGLSAGRIVSVQVDGGGDCTGITIDAPVEMEASVSYGLSIRTADNVELTAEIVTDEGLQTILTFVTAIPAASNPSVGDLFGFGVLGSETDDALVLEVSPLDLYDARVTAVPYREIVYEIDAGPVPPFDSKLTPVQTLPGVVVENVRSDESVLTVGAGESLSVHIAVKVQPLTNVDGTLQIQSRPSTTGEPFKNAKVDSFIGNEAMVGDVRTGEYVDVRMRWIAPGYVPGDWTVISNHRVVGKSSPPDALIGLTISTYGGQAFFRWEQPRELDVIFGGEVRFRFSADPSPQWSNSTSIGQAAQARALFATLPLKTGTYICRVFDEAGNYSDVAMINSNQASVLEFVPVDTIDEAPTFSGVKTNTIVDGIALKIGGAGAWDDIPDIDAEPDIDAFGGTAEITSGEYFFDVGFDFVTVKRIRLTTRVLAGVFGVNDLIDSWLEDIDLRADFDGTDTAEADCVIYVAQTNDDPAGSPVWGTWERLDSMEVNCRACKFKAAMTSYNKDFNIAVTELGIDAEEIV